MPVGWRDDRAAQRCRQPWQGAATPRHVLEANPEQALYMGEICAAVGASYPTLRACCHEHLGMSPKRYLWLRRMDLARRALRRADPEVATVTEIATGYGFWELGRFSVAYRSLFGKSPSVTLHRPPENSASGKIAGLAPNLSKLHSPRRSGPSRLPTKFRLAIRGPWTLQERDAGRRQTHIRRARSIRGLLRQAQIEFLVTPRGGFNACLTWAELLR